MGARILTVIGTRPEAIKLFPVVDALIADGRFDSRVCTTGQHADLVEPILEMAGISADFALAPPANAKTLDGLLSSLLSGVGEVMDRSDPDVVIVQGDTASALAGAICAHHRRIPVCHVEAGLRTGDLGAPWPEEGNRRQIAALSALHCAPTERACDALLAENISPEAIHPTGNTVVDALMWVRARLDGRFPASSHVREALDRFSGRKLVLVTCHRRETDAVTLDGILAAVRDIVLLDEVAVIWPVHPRPELHDSVHASLGRALNVALLPPLEYPDFVRLLAEAHLIMTDSGGVQEEAPAFGKPVLVMRETSERMEAVEAGSALLVGTETGAIVAAATSLLENPDAYARMAHTHQPFGDGQASNRIVALLASAIGASA